MRHREREREREGEKEGGWVGKGELDVKSAMIVKYNKNYENK